MFYQNHLLTLCTFEMFCNAILTKIIGLDHEKLKTALPRSLDSD